MLWNSESDYLSWTTSGGELMSQFLTGYYMSLIFFQNYTRGCTIIVQPLAIQNVILYTKSLVCMIDTVGSSLWMWSHMYTCRPINSRQLLCVVIIIIQNCCSSLHRVLEPSVLMEMKLSDGTIRTFEVCKHCIMWASMSVSYCVGWYWFLWGLFFLCLFTINVVYINLWCHHVYLDYATKI